MAVMTYRSLSIPLQQDSHRLPLLLKIGDIRAQTGDAGLAVRYSIPSDATRLAQLLRESQTDADRALEAHETFDGRVQKWLPDALTSKKWLASVAESSCGELVGCVCLNVVETVPLQEMRNEVGHITHAYVRPSWRNNGLGGLMLAAVIVAARERGLHELHVWTRSRAVSLYARAGFFAAADAGCHRSVLHLQHPVSHGDSRREDQAESE